jgi:hypothetical protein
MKPSPSQRRSVFAEHRIATGTHRTNHQVIQPAKCQSRVGHADHVPYDALPANVAGIRFENADPFRERRIDTLHTSLS